MAKIKAKARAKRGRGRPRGFGSVPRQFKDRFQKFYYEHRDRLNRERRASYVDKKHLKVCVRCKRKVVKGSIFCAMHRAKSREYNQG